MRRALVTSLLAFVALQLLAGPALAFPEWCDDGSPPPNDFRFRQTDSHSDVSRPAWLASTTSGELTFTPYATTLAGGVARGMREALEHAGTK